MMLDCWQMFSPFTYFLVLFLSFTHKNSLGVSGTTALLSKVHGDENFIVYILLLVICILMGPHACHPTTDLFLHYKHCWSWVLVCQHL